jgi:Holliday junction resolvasome RuvABC endonuclease subunit
MSILGVDLGTTFGWATLVDGVGVESGSYKIKTKPNAPKGERYYQFYTAIQGLLRQGVTQIYYEDVKRHIGTDAAHVYGGYRAILLCLAFQLDIPVTGIGVGTIKKCWTGKGNATKGMMIAEAGKRSFTPHDDNEADALAILHCGIDMENTP